MEIFFITLVVMLVVAGIWFRWHLENKRSTELQAFASSRGLAFRRSHDSDADERLARFTMFQRGRSRKAWNTIRGSVTLGNHEVELEMGDFRYTIETGSGKNRRSETRRFSYLVAHNPIGHCPEVIIRREGFFDRVKGVLGFDDIDFESDEFSRRFHVSSDDKRFAYDLVDPGMMEYLMKTSPPALELDGGLLCVSDGKGRWDPDEFQRMSELVGGLFDRWPRHLASSMAGGERVENAP